MAGDNLLVQMRKRVSLTQRQVAEVVSVTVQTVSNWETGRSEPKLTPEQTLLLCRILQCSLEELVKGFEDVFQTAQSPTLDE